MNEDNFLIMLLAATTANPYRDKENEHNDGDAVVAAALRHLGYNRLADEYDRLRDTWWYA